MTLAILALCNKLIKLDVRYNITINFAQLLHFKMYTLFQSVETHLLSVNDITESINQ